MTEFTETINDVIGSTIYECEGEGLPYDTADNWVEDIQKCFIKDLHTRLQEVAKVHGNSGLQDLEDKLADIFNDRIYEAVENALSKAEEYVINQLYEIEQDLFDAVDTESEDSEELGA